MVLQQAAQLSDKAEVRFAALTHDLGKATTKAEILPHHYGHEGRSKRLVSQLCRRYKVPKRFRSLAEQVANYHTHVHKAFELKPQTLLKVLENVGAFRQPNQFEDFLIACKADSRGRLGYEQKDYPQIEYYLAILNLCKQIKVQDVITAGFKGKAIAQQLRKQRLAAIRTYKNSIVPTKF
jgi:tRNA nucleotidyltransferase (CCA-adding enzyme)